MKSFFYSTKKTSTFLFVGYNIMEIFQNLEFEHLKLCCRVPKEAGTIKNRKSYNQEVS